MASPISGRSIVSFSLNGAGDLAEDNSEFKL